MKKISAYILFLIFIFINKGFSQTVTVISPNGGESWVADNTHTITWSDNFDPQVKIELFKGGAFHSVIKSSTISNGIYEWEIDKSIPSDSDYTVKITKTDNSLVFDFSDENFTIVANEVTVTSPNGGEDWKAGTTQTITWTDNFDENVKIDLFKGGVFKFSLPDGGNSTPSDGSFNWTIPFDITGGSDYNIRIASTQNSSVVFDNSNGNFTITPNQITITSPIGGEIWRTVVPQTITWNDNFTGTVKIELFQGGQDPGDLYSVLTSSTSNGSFLWNISTDVKPANDYLIKITSNLNNNVFDFSDNNFTIVGFNIRVTSPNGGEEWLLGYRRDIVWTDNIAENVKIDLYKGGLFHSTIDFSSSSVDGVQPWDIPLSSISQGGDYRIRIMSVDDSTLFDFSDGDFTLFLPKITINSPNGGEIWQPGTSNVITWTDNIDEAVQIDLYKNDAIYSSINPSTPSDGAFTWNIPTETEAGSDYKIRITGTINDIILDFSDGNFTIIGATGVEERFSEIPDTYEIMQNYPNPFNPSTTIYYALPEAGSVELVIYDVLGNEVMKYSENQEAGYHKFEFDASDLTSGIYFYRLQAGIFIETKKMVLLK